MHEDMVLTVVSMCFIICWKQGGSDAAELVRYLFQDPRTFLQAVRSIALQLRASPRITFLVKGTFFFFAQGFTLLQARASDIHSSTVWCGREISGSLASVWNVSEESSRPETSYQIGPGLCCPLPQFSRFLLSYSPLILTALVPEGRPPLCKSPI